VLLSGVPVRDHRKVLVGTGSSALMVLQIFSELIIVVGHLRELLRLPEEVGREEE